MQTKRQFGIIFILVVVLLNSSLCFASYTKKIIRVAILDNFHFQPNISNHYDNYYLRGIEIGKFAAKEKNITIEYKVFRYPRSPLAILNSIPDVINWNPDVVIGPRNSNMFLTIRNSFKNILVLSPFATSSKIESMPSNYYSLSLPDKYMAQAISIFVQKHYSKFGIYSIVEADCKNCVDINQEFKRIMVGRFKSNYVEKFYLQSSVKLLNIKNLLNEYKPNDLIFLPNTSYSSAVLMLNITNYLKYPIFFIGGDDWGTSKNTEAVKLKANFPYYGFHVTPWSLDVDTKVKKEFTKKYRKLYSNESVDASSLLGYTVIISIIDALNRFGDNNKSNMKNEILLSYMKALKNNKNWYRPSIYVFSKRTANEDTPVDQINLFSVIN